MYNPKANTDRLVVTRRGTFPRQWFLVVMAKETKHTYHWAHPELLDQRPLPELCEILATHYGTKELALELVSHGDIITLGKAPTDDVMRMQGDDDGAWHTVEAKTSADGHSKTS